MVGRNATLPAVEERCEPRDVGEQSSLHDDDETRPPKPHHARQILTSQQRDKLLSFQAPADTLQYIQHRSQTYNNAEQCSSK